MTSKHSLASMLERNLETRYRIFGNVSTGFHKEIGSPKVSPLVATGGMPVRVQPKIGFFCVFKSRIVSQMSRKFFLDIFDIQKSFFRYLKSKEAFLPLFFVTFFKEFLAHCFLDTTH